MAAGLIAVKAGMTQIFGDAGEVVPVTVLRVEPCRVVATRSVANDGYSAIQVGYGKGKPKKMSRAEQGHFAKLGQEVMGGLIEFRDADASLTAGTELTAALFAVGQKVDISGVSRGRGFAGVMKRYNFAGGRATHGCEKTHRQMGSTGMRQDPGRVFPGQKMPGHYGAKRSTVQNLKVVRVDSEQNTILVKGAVPGATGALVEIRPAVKGA